MHDIVALTADHTDKVYDLLRVFSGAFGDPGSSLGAPPSEAYLKRLLSSERVIALACIRGGKVIGGLVAHELMKLERERSEIYLYDIAVDAGFRRRGIASALLDRLQRIAEDRGASVVYVQADADDDPAVALYASRGSRTAVCHFEFRTAIGF